MRKLAFLLSSGILLGILLTGCAKEEIPLAEPTQSATAAMDATKETTPPAVSVPEPASHPEAASRLAEAEAKHTALQDQLMGDPSLTQADMNDLAGQQYTLWDELLNELWADLTHTLPDGQMQQLLQEERAWIRWKEHSIAMAANYYDGGSLSILSGNLRAATMTRERVYELAEILTAGQYPAVHSRDDLYHQVFLVLASAQQPDYENLRLLLEFRSFSLKEDEGVVEIRDPRYPDAYVFGSLSNETGTLTISQLGYCIANGTSQMGVRVDYFTIPPAYYIDAIFWDDGTEVSSLEALTDYLQTPQA